ncbi:MAG: hypothetical protein KKD32_13385 [Proteobacteria bacterium]|nr:hypothetical protein [Pseudomonadota bacterium]MBU1388830.1 hypothetical protein [Pseudomonadota bacterium]
MAINKFRWFVGTVFLFLLVSAYAYADVNVIAEGTYTDTQLTVTIFVDTTDLTNGDADPIVSYGVKLIYSPADLTNPTVTENDTDWYFGSPEAPLPTPNTAPDTSTDGEVIIVGGKIDILEPTAGVSGPKVLLATVVFDRISESIPEVSLELGKAGTYANFVTNVGDVLDGTDRINFLSSAITQECILNGDLNGDNRVNMSDFYIMQANWGRTGENIADLNGDNRVNMSDFYIIQANWGKTCP